MNSHTHSPDFCLARIHFWRFDLIEIDSHFEALTLAIVARLIPLTNSKTCFNFDSALGDAKPAKEAIKLDSRAVLVATASPNHN